MKAYKCNANCELGIYETTSALCNNIQKEFKEKNISQ